MKLGSLSMSTFKELRMGLECSLKEIFRVTVSDILDSVEGSLSDHQRKIQRIEFENAVLRRMLFQSNNRESTPADTGDNEEVMTYTSCTMTSQNTIKFDEIKVDPGHNVKTKPVPESSHATDLSKPPAPVQLTRRSMMPGVPGGAHGGSDVTDGSHDTHTPQPPISDLQQDCGGGREEEAGLPVIVEVYSIKAETNGLDDEHRTADAAARSTDTATLKPSSIAEASPPVTGDSAPAPAPIPLPESSRPAPPRGTGGLEAGAKGGDVNSHTCASCGKWFRRADLLRSHGCLLLAKAYAHPSQQRTHTGERPYSCTYCGKCFKKRCLLTAHQRTHTGERPYCCGACGKTFSNMGSLRVHERLHTGEWPYGCAQCGKHFNGPGDLKAHTRVHTGERPYSCGTCGKAFIIAATLRNHERIHTGERPYGCSTCGKTFIRMGNLRNHEHIHTGERPYCCSLCPKTFSRAGHLKNHALVHTRYLRRPLGPPEASADAVGAVKEGDSNP